MNQERPPAHERGPLLDGSQQQSFGSFGELDFGARAQAESLAQRLGQHDPPGGIDLECHAILYGIYHYNGKRDRLHDLVDASEDSHRRGKAMIEAMATVRITEAELARDLPAILAKVQQGVEAVIEQDHRPVAVIRTPPRSGRRISECIALAKAYEENLGYTPVPDPEFARDVQAAIDAHRDPVDLPRWD